MILVLAGCSGSAVHVLKAPDPKLLPGWNLYSDPQDGVKVGLPPGWRVGVDTTLSGLQMADDISQNSGQSGTGTPNPLADLENKMKADDKAEEREALAKLREKGTLINAIDSSKTDAGRAANKVLR